MKSSVPYLLISDLDDTLLGDDQALRRFHDFYQAECGDMLDLIYASGRFAESIRNDVLTTDLPDPVYIIGGVGSEIRRFEDDSGVAEWEKLISEGAEFHLKCNRPVTMIQPQCELQKHTQRKAPWNGHTHILTALSGKS